jgi:acyl-CoA synthetase (AMP-forming)/AMP-acid ligase II/acyl carrier protein
MGLIGNLLNPFWMRRPCILLPPQAFLRNPRAWLEAISHYRATTSGGPTFAFEHCADRIDGDLSDLDLSSWRVAFVGAEPVRAAALARFARRFAPAGFVRSAFYPCYGLAEATLIVTGANRSAAPEAPPTDSGQGIVEEGTGSQKDTVGCGVALGGQAVAIVHPERLDECRPGETGEVWIAGSAVAAGYVADPESTQATFGGRLSDGRGPYLRTGDLGTMSNGQLFVQGRLKNLVIVAGTNIVAEDVEAWIGGCHPSIVPSAVAAYAIGDGGREALAVALEIRRDAERSSAFAEIVDSVRARAAELVDVPVSEVVLYRAGGLPRTTSGKLQRWRCATPESDDDQRIIHRSILIGNDVRSRNAGLGSIARDSYAIQTWLQERVARVLGTEAARVSSNAAFAHLGLSSADALAVTHELGLALGLELENTLFWEYPTIGSVAAYLSGDSQ